MRSSKRCDRDVEETTWRRERDSNPRSAVRRTAVFETAPFGRSGISPMVRIARPPAFDHLVSRVLPFASRHKYLRRREDNLAALFPQLQARRALGEPSPFTASPRHGSSCASVKASCGAPPRTRPAQPRLLCGLVEDANVFDDDGFAGLVVAVTSDLRDGGHHVHPLHHLTEDGCGGTSVEWGLDFQGQWVTTPKGDRFDPQCRGWFSRVKIFLFLWGRSSGEGQWSRGKSKGCARLGRSAFRVSHPARGAGRPC